MLIQQIAEVPNTVLITSEMNCMQFTAVPFILLSSKNMDNSNGCIGMLQTVWSILACPWDVGGGNNLCKGQLRVGDRDHSGRLGSGSRLTTFSSAMKYTTGPRN